MCIESHYKSKAIAALLLALANGSDRQIRQESIRLLLGYSNLDLINGAVFAIKNSQAESEGVGP